MGNKTRLASFCRLCLTKTQNKVPVFSEDNTVENLLQLIEIQVNQGVEPDAVVCYDCVVTLEGFFQFKEQCHVNDDFVKNIPVVDETSNYEEDEDEADNYDYIEEEDVEDNEHSEPIDELEEKVTIEELVIPKSKRKASQSPKMAPTAKVGKISSKSMDADEVASKFPRKAHGPTIEEMQVLEDSYPDFFYFEKGPRTVYFTLVFYGERYHSALFTERYTYWQCKHRIKYHCPAQVCVTNDYKVFERRGEHTHGDLPFKEGKIFTPLQALPELFAACRKVVLRSRTKRRQKLLEKHKQRSKQQIQQDNEGEDGSDALNRVIMESGINNDDVDGDDDYVDEEEYDDDD
ncbi:uncharacterized protein LOC131692151 [Topomyia yanbarensis]|uniref:uncharacterized protein LOC131692151 n=1 Tax=Topomyia yanbarensis TaxID=2498891 RepID=UPI00273BFB03|nr:uncharacterized protein LOC131692151 [Topomyia yanbarensis]